MDSDTQIYRSLQRHLDRLPMGFPQAESGVDIRLLRRLFTPEEAKTALLLSIKPEPLNRIYHRVKKGEISIQELQKRLDQMVLKGILLANNEGYDETHYSSAGFSAGGIYNFQVDRLTKDLIVDYHQHLKETRPKPKEGQKRILPLRTIPVEKSIPLPEKFQVSNYDSLRKIIDDVKGPIAVANCICRQSQDILGEPCSKTDLRETCLMVAPDHAKRHVDMKIGRYVTKEEALDILEKAQEAGLVLQPENAQKPEAICCCCGDCCILLKSVKKHPRPAEIYETNFFIELIPENCTGCQECVEGCQLNAREMVDGVAAVNLDRCIGCGNCVVICDYNANRLTKKEPEEKPPRDKDALNMAILSNKVSPWRMRMIRMKMLLGLKV